MFPPLFWLVDYLLQPPTFFGLNALSQGLRPTCRPQRISLAAPQPARAPAFLDGLVAGFETAMSAAVWATISPAQISAEACTRRNMWTIYRRLMKQLVGQAIGN
jgi:hypothetical protein